MNTKKPDPHAIEGHSQAHAQAFDSMIERMAKAVEQAKQPVKEIGSRTHRAYPRLGGFGRKK